MIDTSVVAAPPSLQQERLVSVGLTLGGRFTSSSSPPDLSTGHTLSVKAAERSPSPPVCAALPGFTTAPASQKSCSALALQTVSQALDGTSLCKDHSALGAKPACPALLLGRTASLSSDPAIPVLTVGHGGTNLSSSSDIECERGVRGVVSVSSEALAARLAALFANSARLNNAVGRDMSCSSSVSLAGPKGILSQQLPGCGRIFTFPSAEAVDLFLRLKQLVPTGAGEVAQGDFGPASSTVCVCCNAHQASDGSECPYTAVVVRRTNALWYLVEGFTPHAPLARRNCGTASGDTSSFSCVVGAGREASISEGLPGIGAGERQQVACESRLRKDSAAVEHFRLEEGGAPALYEGEGTVAPPAKERAGGESIASFLSRLQAELDHKLQQIPEEERTVPARPGACSLPLAFHLREAPPGLVAGKEEVTKETESPDIREPPHLRPSCTVSRTGSSGAYTQQERHTEKVDRERNADVCGVGSAHHSSRPGVTEDVESSSDSLSAAWSCSSVWSQDSPSSFAPTESSTCHPSPSLFGSSKVQLPELVVPGSLQAQEASPELCCGRLGSGTSLACEPSFGSERSGVKEACTGSQPLISSPKKAVTAPSGTLTRLSSGSVSSSFGAEAAALAAGSSEDDRLSLAGVSPLEDLSSDTGRVVSLSSDLMVVSGKRKEGEAVRGEDLHATATTALLPCAASEEALGRVEQLQQLLQNQPALLSAASSLVPLLNDMAGTTSGKQQSVFGAMGGDGDYAASPGTGGAGDVSGLHKHRPDIALASSSSPNGGSSPSSGTDLFSSGGGCEGCGPDEMEGGVGPEKGDKMEERMVLISGSGSSLEKHPDALETQEGNEEESSSFSCSQSRSLPSGLHGVVDDAGIGVSRESQGCDVDSSDLLDSRTKNNAHSPTMTLSTGEGNMPPASVKLEEEGLSAISPLKTSLESGGSRLLKARDKVLNQHHLLRKRKKVSGVVTSPDALSGDISRSAEEDNASLLLDDSSCSVAEDTAMLGTTGDTSDPLEADGDDRSGGLKEEEIAELNHEERTTAAALGDGTRTVKKESLNATQCGRKKRVRGEGGAAAVDGCVGGSGAWSQSGEEGRAEGEPGIMEPYEASADNVNDVDSSSSVMPNNGCSSVSNSSRIKREEAEPKRSRRSTRSSASLVASLNSSSIGPADARAGEGEAERECSSSAPGFVFDSTEQSPLSTVPRPNTRGLQHHVFLEAPSSLSTGGRSVGLPGSFPGAATVAGAASIGSASVSAGGAKTANYNNSPAGPRVPGDSHASAADVERNDLMMRPGVSYYGGRQAWVAEIKYGGRRRFKVFSVAKYGYEGAKQMAVDTRERWEEAREAGELDQLMMSSQRHQCPVQSGVKGVYYDTARKGWRVVVTLNCRQMSKFFLASKFGNAEAKRLAIECRQMWLDAIQNGRADDVFEKARKLVSFKTKGNNNQNNNHPNGNSTSSSSVNSMLLGGNPAALANQSVILQAAGGLPPTPGSTATAAPTAAGGGAGTAAAACLAGKFSNALAGNVGDSSSSNCVFGNPPGTAPGAVGGDSSNELFLASAGSHAASSSSLIAGLAGGGTTSPAELAAAAGGVDASNGAAFLSSSSSFAAGLRGGNAGSGAAAEAGAAAGVFASADAAANALLASTAAAAQTSGGALDPKLLQHHHLAAAHQQLVLQQWSNEAGNVANVCIPSALLSAAAAGGGATDSDGHPRDPTASAVLQQQQHQQLQLQLLQELRGGSLPLLADVLWPAGAAAAAAAAAGNAVTEPSCAGVVVGEGSEMVGLQGARNGSSLLGGAAGGAVGGIVGDGQPSVGEDAAAAPGPCGLPAPVLSLLLQQQGAQQHQQLVAAAVAARGCGGSVSPAVSTAALCGFGAGAGREGNNMMLLGAGGACPTLLSPSIMTDGSTADPNSVIGSNLFLNGANPGLLLHNTSSKRARRAQQQQLGVGGVGPLVSGGHSHHQSAGMPVTSRRTKKETNPGQDPSRPLPTTAGGGGSETSTCEVRGVYLDTRNNAWAATMGVHGRNVKKSFAVAKHGYETALQLAIHARRQLERLYWGPNHPSNSAGTNSATTNNNDSSGQQQQQPNAQAPGGGGVLPSPSPGGETTSSRSAVTTPSLPSHSPSPAAPTPAQLTLLQQQQQLVQLQQQQLAGQLQQGLCWNPTNAAAAAAVVNAACRGGEDEESRLVAAAGAEMLALRSAMEKNAEVLSGLTDDPTVNAEAAARTAAVTGSLLYGSQFSPNQTQVNRVSALNVGGSSASTGTATGGDTGGMSSAASGGSGSSPAISGLATGAGTPSQSSSGGPGVVVVGGVGGDRLSVGRGGATTGLQVRGSTSLHEGRSPPGAEGGSTPGPGLLCGEAAAASASLTGAGATAAEGATQHPHTPIGGPTLLGCGLEGREGGMPVVMPLAANPAIGLLQAAAAAGGGLGGGGVAGGGVGVAAGGLMMRDALAALLLQLDPQQRAALLQGEMMTALNGGLAPSLSPVQHQQQLLMCNADAQQLLLAVTGGAEGTGANTAAACVDDVGLANATRGLLSSGLNEALLQQAQRHQMGAGGGGVSVVQPTEATNEAAEDTGRGPAEGGKAEETRGDCSTAADGGSLSQPHLAPDPQGAKEGREELRTLGLVTKAAAASSSPGSLFAAGSLHGGEDLEGLPVHLQGQMTPDTNVATATGVSCPGDDKLEHPRLSVSSEQRETDEGKVAAAHSAGVVGISLGVTPTTETPLEGTNRGGTVSGISEEAGGGVGAGREGVLDGVRKVQEGEAAFALLSSASREGPGSEIVDTGAHEVGQNPLVVAAGKQTEFASDEKASG